MDTDGTLTTTMLAGQQANLNQQHATVSQEFKQYKDMYSVAMSTIAARLNDPHLNALVKNAGIEIKTNESSSSELSDNDLRQMFSTVIQMMSSLQNWGEKIDKIGSSLKQLQTDVKDLDRQVHHDEQYSKNYNLLIHNLNNVPKNKHGLEFNHYVAQEINKMPLMRYLPNIDDLGGRIQITTKDIDISHIYKTK